MPQQPITIQSFKGLHIQANSFSQVPDGSLERAENVVITNDGILKKRRGFSLLTDSTSLTTPRALTEYSGALLVAHNNVLAQVDRSTGSLTALSGAFIPGTSKPRFAQANGNLYGTTSEGVRKVESLTAALLPAGIPAGLDLTVSISGNSGIHAPNTQVGYRVCFGRKDVSGNKVVGAPSELTTVTNAWLNTSAAATAGAYPATTVTITSTAHGLSTGDLVKLADPTGTGNAGLAGEWTITVTGANTFTVTITSAITGASTVKLGRYRTPSLNYSLPPGLSTSHFVQIYRTTQSSDASAVGDAVSDDGQLVYEGNLTSAQVTAGSGTFTDDVDELFKGADLYTNPNQSGIASANFPPPLSEDVAVFKSCAFYANIETAHELSLGLVSVQAADFAAANYIEIISGATTRRYVATTSAAGSESTPTYVAATPNTSVSWDYGGTNASGHVYFRLVNSTSSTIASAIAQTAKSLCKAINRDASGLVYAYYVSGPEDIPGSIRLVRRVNASAFSVKAQNATVGDCFSPEVWNGGSGRTSTNTDLPNALAFSKPQEPEAVPLPYQLLVGAKSAPIQRIVPLRDSLLVLKSDGLWRVSGEGPSSFAVTLVDSTISCVAPDSVVPLNNQVFFLSTQGVVSATETSAQVLSRPIEAIISPILGNSVLSAQTAAAGYESERLYMLSTIQPSSSTADVVYVYSTVTQAWTTWNRTFKDGLVFSGDDRLYVLDSSSRVLKERKSQNQLDYCDFSQSVTCLTANPTTKQATFSGTTMGVGDALVQVGSENINRVASVDTTTVPPVVTFTFPLAFTVGDSCIAYSPITSTIKTTPLTLGDATVWKMFSDVRVAFRNRATTRLRFTFDSDSRTADETPWEATSEGNGWGYSWGSEWGGASIATIYQTQASQEARVWVPLETSRGTYLQTTIAHERAAESFEMQSLSITSRPFGHRVTR